MSQSQAKAIPSRVPPDPEEYRMSLGDHLEELRKRIFFALIGLVIAGIFTSIYGQEVISIFCRPLVNALLQQHINPQLYYGSAAEPFTVYMEMTMIAAAILAGPWIIWQLWLFIAAGLYERERKAVWRYAPLSILLMLAGVAMCYFVVLPLALHFFIGFGSEIPILIPHHVAPATTQPALQIPAMDGDPANPVAYQMWFDSAQQRLKFALPVGNAIQTMVVNFGPQSLVSPHITLPEYVDMAMRWLVVFAVGFQLPLVTLALVHMGLVEIQTLRKFRKYVYTALMIISAILIPEIFTGMLALMLPLWGLYELGILLAALSQRSKTRHDDDAAQLT